MRKHSPVHRQAGTSILHTGCSSTVEDGNKISQNCNNAVNSKRPSLRTHLDKLGVLHKHLQVVTDQAVVVNHHIYNCVHKVLLRISKVVQPPVLEPLPAPVKTGVQECFFQ